MISKDKAAFTDELTTTIQCVSGTMRPPATLLAAFYDALKDLELKDLLRILKRWRRDSNSWPSPAAIRAAIEGRPDEDTFNDYFDNYVAKGRGGQFKHPIGKQVIAALGGSGAFQMMNIRDRNDWKRRWVKTYREIASGSAKVSAKSK